MVSRRNVVVDHLHAVTTHTREYHLDWDHSHRNHGSVYPKASISNGIHHLYDWRNTGLCCLRAVSDIGFSILMDPRYGSGIVAGQYLPEMVSHTDFTSAIQDC